MFFASAVAHATSTSGAAANAAAPPTAASVGAARL